MIGADARVLWQLVRGQSRKGAHAERLQAFYAPQAARYDAFRDRLLHGRRELVERLVPPAGARVVELGAGTGHNLQCFGDRLAEMTSVALVDLCPALLEQARKRTAHLTNVHLVESDAATYRPTRPVDCVFFAYSLTMIPDWRDAIDNALAMLKPGGTLGVVDFYVSDAQPDCGLMRHGAFTRNFWPRWFAHDGVRLNPEHLCRLRSLLPQHELLERRAPIPFLPGLKAPYYLFVGRLPRAPNSMAVP